MTGMHLAQLNIARMLAPLDSPQMADFVDALESVNALADAAPGFIWRLKDDGPGALSIRPFGDDMLVNLSLWQDAESLINFVYKQEEHAKALRKRREWFEFPNDAKVVCWAVPEGQIPTLEEAEEKLMQLRENGSGPEAFSLTAARDFFRS